MTVPPFAAAPADAVGRARELVADADAVVVASEAAGLGANPVLCRSATDVLVVGDGQTGTRVAPDGLVPALAALGDAGGPFAVADGGNDEE